MIRLALTLSVLVACLAAPAAAQDPTAPDPHHQPRKG